MTAPKYCSHDSLLRALLWLQQSPPLFSQRASAYITKTALPETIPLYTPNQQALEYLKGRLANKPWLPLGIYYETLWQFLLEKHPDLQLLAHNLQVVKKQPDTQTTLGEYDLIYQHHNRIYHRELAIKFYLGVPLSTDEQSPLHHWVGPGLRDRLDRKMHRLLSHQIVLSDLPEGRQALTGLNSGKVQKEILLQGRLFYPLSGNCPPPVHSHPGHLRGYWLTISHYKEWLSRHSSHQVRILNKPFWLDNELLDENQPLSECLKILEQQKQPQMIKHSDQYLFVVPDRWPEQARQCTESAYYSEIRLA